MVEYGLMVTGLLFALGAACLIGALAMIRWRDVFGSEIGRANPFVRGGVASGRISEDQLQRDSARWVAAPIAVFLVLASMALVWSAVSRL